MSKFDYTYDAVGNILTWRQQADNDAVVWEYGYDVADQLVAAIKKSTDPTPAVLNRYGYAYDAAGNRTVEQIDNQLTGATYDNLNRLVSQQPSGAMVFAGTVSEPATVTVQAMPAAVTSGNQFRASVPVGTGTNTVTVTAHDPSGNVGTQQYEVDSFGSGRTFTYDANGNLTSDGTRTFEWDARNQLVAITVATHRTEFSYDGEQRRVRILESENGVTEADIRLVWCATDICEERAANGTTVLRRAFMHAEQVSGNVQFVVADHLGSVRDVTDGTSTLLARYSFDPWGRRTVDLELSVASTGFTGYRWHGLSGIALSLYRGYDGDLGRWISLDPAGFPDGPNRYAYVVNNPVANVDLLGLLVEGYCTPIGAGDGAPWCRRRQALLPQDQMRLMRGAL